MADVLPQEPPPTNRGLWMLVIGLGIAILLVLAAMVGMAVKRAMFDKPQRPAATATLEPGDVPELNIDLAPGMNVAETRIDGGLLIVRIAGPQTEEILIVDPAKSKVLSRVRLNKKAP